MIVELVNSFLDRPGNIGIRTARILDELGRRSGEEVLCISRGGHVDRDGIHCIGMGPLGHISRLLNAARIYLAPSYNHRALDTVLYSGFAATALTVLRPESLSLAHLWEYAPSLIRWLKRKGIPVVLDVPIAPAAYVARLQKEGRYLHGRIFAEQDRMEREAFALADLLVVPSEFVMEELERIGVARARMRLVPFGVDFPPLHARGGSLVADGSSGTSNGIEWVMLGNVNYRKGVAELLNAFSDPVFASDRLHLCGRVNPEVKGLLDIAGPNIITPGFVSPSEYLKRCHVFVMPSWMEGSSKAVFEAMAMGLPCIVSKSTGSVVRDGLDGYIIDAGDVNALKSAMLRFKQVPQQIRSMGKNARQRASEFSWDRYADRVVDMYCEVLGRKVFDR